jgi:GT2 family glycosyltransferase
VKTAAIVVAHNSARDLPYSLGCTAALPLARTVVVDNASGDGSAALARSYTPDVLIRSNDGFGAAVNAATAHLAGLDAYLLLNPDCRLAPDDFAALVDALRDDPRLGVVGPGMRYPDGRYGIAGGPEPSVAKEWLAALGVDHLVPARVKRALAGSAQARARLPMLGYLAVEPGDEARPVAWVSGFCMLVRARAFHAVGGFDPGFFLYFEDVDLCRRLRAVGWGVASVGTAVAEHRESTSTSAVGKRRLYQAGLVAYFSRHGTRGQRLFARLLGGTLR